jgi:Na+-driven multidrug efflux pump
MQMAAPLVVSFWMRAAFTLVDTIYAATIGDEAVAAIGLTVPFEFLMIALWVGLSTGLTSCLSRSFGAVEPRKVVQYTEVAWRLVWVVVPAFLLLGLGIWLWAPRMGLELEVASAFRVYGTVLVTGSAVSAFWSVIPDSLIKAHQDTRSTMWAGIWSNVINLALNTLFLFVFGWGVFGIALSTVLGRFGGLAYAVIRAKKLEEQRESEWREVDSPREAIDPQPYRSILALAVPAALTFALMSLEPAIVNWLLARFDNATEAIAAYSIYYRVVLFMLNPIIALGVAMLPYAAKRFGARDLAGVRRGLGQAVAATGVYAVAFCLPAMLVAAPYLASWLAESPVTAAYARFGLRIVPLACLVTAPFILCRPVFEGMQRGKPGLAMAALRYLLLALPLAWLGVKGAEALGRPGFEGVVVGLVVASAATSVLFAAWLGSAVRGFEQRVGPAPLGAGRSTAG